MFRFETIALVLVTLLPVVAGAVDCYGRYEMRFDDLMKMNPRPRDYETRKREILTEREACERRENDRVGDCSQAESNFNDAVRSMQAACQAQGLPTSSQTGSIACSHETDRCECLTKGLKPTEAKYLNCTGVDRSKLKFCPQLAEAQQERLDKLREKTEERAEKLKDKIREAQNEKQRNEEKAADKKKEARKEKAAADKEYAQGVADAKREENEKEKARLAEMNSIQEKMSQANDALRTAKLKDSAALREMLKKKQEIELGCVSQAMTAVSSMQQEAIQSMRVGTYNRGNQSDIFRQVGLTDRQMWQRQASKRKRWCMESEVVAKSYESVNMAHQGMLEANQSEAESAKVQLAGLNQQMLQVENPAGCQATAANGAVTQTQACRDVNENTEKLKALGETKNAAHGAALEDEAAADANLHKANFSKDQQIGEMKADLQGQQTTLNNLRDAEAAQNGFPNAGGPTAQETARNLASGIAQLTQHSLQVNRCCDINSRSVSSQACTRAKAFLTEKGITVDTPARSSTPAVRPNTEDGSFIGM